MGRAMGEMAGKKPSKAVHFLTAQLIWVAVAGGALARALPLPAQFAKAPPQQATVGSTALPDDVQLVNANTNPTIRIPVGHSSLNWTLIKPRIRASYGWLEIDRLTVRYSMARPSRITKEADQGFGYGRSEISDIKMEFGAAEFRARGLRHFFGYSPPTHWDAADSPNASVNSISRADNVYVPVILRALQDFDSVVAELKAKQQAAATPPVAPLPAPPPAPKPVSAPSPPTLVVMAPSGASDNQTIEVNESPLNIRGVVMDSSGLPTVTINGSPAALRPKGENVAEFWSDPMALKPGANSFEITATSPAKGISHIKFVAHFTPKAAPVNPRALDKEEIISLLQGGVPASRIAQLVRDRSVKFAPTPAALNDIRAAGGSDELIQAIQQAATPGK